MLDGQGVGFGSLFILPDATNAQDTATLQKTASSQKLVQNVQAIILLALVYQMFLNVLIVSLAMRNLRQIIT